MGTGIEIETDEEGSEIDQVPCSINKKQINCNQSVYTDKIAWRTSRAYVNEQIRRLRSQLGELKEIRSHLKAKRPNVYIEYPAEIDMADLDGDLLQIEDDLARTLQRKTMTTSAEKNQRHCNCKSKRNRSLLRSLRRTRRQKIRKIRLRQRLRRRMIRQKKLKKSKKKLENS